jgi:acid phosphatase type 7
VLRNVLDSVVMGAVNVEMISGHGGVDSDYFEKGEFELRILLRTCFLLALVLVAVVGQAQPLTILAIGDTGDCDTGGTEKVSAALRAQPDWQRATLVEVGDLAYPAATVARMHECHEPHFAMFPHRLAVPGNHDWNARDARGFFSVFPGPVPRMEKLNHRWQLWLIDSNLTGTRAVAQLRWLEQAKKSAAGHCVIAVWHHPPWSSSFRGGTESAHSLWHAVASVATFTLHGHDHHYESLPRLDGAGEAAERGTRSFIVGNGGARLYPTGLSRAGSKVATGLWGFLRIDIDGDDYRWEAVSVDGAILDAGVDHCLPVGGNRGP